MAGHPAGDALAELQPDAVDHARPEHARGREDELAVGRVVEDEHRRVARDGLCDLREHGVERVAVVRDHRRIEAPCDRGGDGAGAATIVVVERTAVEAPAQVDEADGLLVAPEGDGEPVAVVGGLAGAGRRTSDERLERDDLARGEDELVALGIVQQQRQRLGRRDALDGVEHRADELAEVERGRDGAEARVEALQLVEPPGQVAVGRHQAGLYQLPPSGRPRFADDEAAVPSPEAPPPAAANVRVFPVSRPGVRPRGGFCTGGPRSKPAACAGAGVGMPSEGCR